MTQIRSKHNFIIYSFFKLYTLLSIRRHFKKVMVKSEISDTSRPVLLLQNHISWWDGFWALYLNMKIFHKKFHFMMLAEQLNKYWFFKYTGGYPVMKGTRSILETLDYTGKLLSDKNNLVLIFPQGEIQSLYQNRIRFENGVSKIIRDNPDIQVIMSVCLIDYFSSPEVSLFIYLREYSDFSKKIEEEYQKFYMESVSRQTEIINHL